MMTSVGHDVITACASIRAGIVRPSEVLHCPVMDEDTHETEPLIGHPISNITDGFSSVGRWATMGHYAIKDLINYAKIPDRNEAGFWQKTAFVFVTSSLDAARFEFEDIINPENAKHVYVEPVIAQIGLPVLPENCLIVSEDNVGIISACIAAQKLLENPAVDRVVLLVADSCLDAYSLVWLRGMGQLKTPTNPVGLMPGEASAAIMLESQDAIQRRGAYPIAKINAYNTKVEANNIFSETPNSGEAMSNSMQETLSRFNRDEPFEGTIYIDLNGECWRAREYGAAQVRVSSLLGSGVSEVIPSIVLGDIGVVNAACSLCIMIEAKKRGYSINDNALILASSASGTVGSLAAQVL